MIKCLMYRNDVSALLTEIFGEEIQIKHVNTLKELSSAADEECADLICWDFSVLDEEYPEEAPALRNNASLCQAAFVCIGSRGVISSETECRLLRSGIQEIIYLPMDEELIRVHLENAIKYKNVMREVSRSRWLEYMNQKISSDNLLFAFEIDLFHNRIISQKISQLAKENYLPLSEYFRSCSSSPNQALVYPDDIPLLSQTLRSCTLIGKLSENETQFTRHVRYRIQDSEQQWVWVEQEIFCHLDYQSGNQCFSAIHLVNPVVRDLDIYEKAISSDVLNVSVLDLQRDILRQVYSDASDPSVSKSRSYSDNYRFFFSQILSGRELERANIIFAPDEIRRKIKQDSALHHQFYTHFRKKGECCISIEITPYDEKQELLIFLVRDVTKLVQQQREQQMLLLSANATKEHLDTIMRINPHAMSTFRINLTKDTLTDGTSAYPNLRRLQEKGTFSGYIRDAAPYLPYNAEREKLLQEFSLKNLTAEYEKGNPQVSLRHRYMISDQEERILITIVSMMKNRLTGDIEGIVYTLDETKEWYYEKINGTLFSNANMAAVIIDVRKRTFIMPQESQLLPFPVSYQGTDFQECLDLITERFLSAEDKQRYRRKGDLDTIIKQLDQHGTYSFSAIWNRDGGSRNMQLTCYYLDEEHEQIIGIAEDITEITQRERRQIEQYRSALHQVEQTTRDNHRLVEELKKALEAAKKANRAKSDFLSNMSHDIRTPLNAIINLTNLLHEEIDQPERLQEDIQKIEVAGEFLLQLINDILDVSLIESGKLTLEPRVYTYDSFLSYIKGIIVPLCEDKDIHFVLDEGPTALDIYMDRVRFHQIFFNILSNAVKYTPPGGTITFKTTNNVIHDGILTCDFIVTDTGCGMSQQFIEHAFEPFEREDSQNAYIGTGLGLSICKRIVDLMGGTISIESHAGKGTKVTVHMDLQIATKEQKEESRAELDTSYLHVSTPMEVSDCRILVVEDNLINREILARLLEKKGYLVELAENGREAVDMVDSHDRNFYQLILMDVRMPVMDGLAATRLIRQNPDGQKSHLPIIAITANAFDQDAQECLSAGMNAYLAKPVSPSALYEMIATYVQVLS